MSHKLWQELLNLHCHCDKRHRRWTASLGQRSPCFPCPSPSFKRPSPGLCLKPCFGPCSKTTWAGLHQFVQNVLSCTNAYLVFWPRSFWCGRKLRRPNVCSPVPLVGNHWCTGGKGLFTYYVSQKLGFSGPPLSAIGIIWLTPLPLCLPSSAFSRPSFGMEWDKLSGTDVAE